MIPRTPSSITAPWPARQGGFTLIELVIVIVVLGIVATVATPEFKSIHVEAKKSEVRASLTSLREAISLYHMKTAANGTAGWPTLDSLRTPDVVMRGAIPPNSFQDPTKAPDSIVQGTVKGQIVGDRGGWAYKPSTGEIWPNTSTTIPGSGCTGPQVINENTW